MGTMNSNNMYNFELAIKCELSLFRKSRPLVLSSITWYNAGATIPY